MNANDLAAELRQQGVDPEWAAWKAHDQAQEDWAEGLVAQARGSLALEFPFFFPDFHQQ